MFKDLECPEYFVEYERNNDTEFRHIKRSCITDGWIPVDNGYDPDDLCLCYRLTKRSRGREEFQGVKSEKARISIPNRKFYIIKQERKYLITEYEKILKKFGISFFGSEEKNKPKGITEQAEQIIFNNRPQHINRSRWFINKKYPRGGRSWLDSREDFEYWREKCNLETLNWFLEVKQKVEKVGYDMFCLKNVIEYADD